MVKLADAARINRREFIDEYQGYELDPTWLDRMAGKAGRGWQALLERSREKVEDLRAEMANALPGLNLAVLGLLMVLAALFMKRGIVGAFEDARKRWFGPKGDQP